MAGEPHPIPTDEPLDPPPVRGADGPAHTAEGAGDGAAQGAASDSVPKQSLRAGAGRLALRVGELAEQAGRRVEELRPRVRGLDAALTTYERERRAAGNVLAGALAFRLFVPLMPLALLLVAALGFAKTEDAGAPAAVAGSLGIREAALNSIADSAKISSGDLVGVAIFAVLALMTSSYAAARTVRAVHALAWGIPPRRFPKALGASAAFIGWMALFFGLWALAAWARTALGPAGIPITVALILGFLAMWIVISRMLPHPPGLPWRAFLPGAILMAVGLEGIQLATVLYFDHKAEEVSAAYGSLGISLVLLLWLYMLGRLIVASAFLNASMAERGRPPQEDAGGGPSG